MKLKPKICCENDYTCIFNMYAAKILELREQFQNNIPVKSQDITIIIKATMHLFQEMKTLNVEMNFIYKNLTMEFIKSFLDKRTKNFCLYLAQHSQYSTIFEEFFKMLSSLQSPQLSSQEFFKFVVNELRAFNNFLSFDNIYDSSIRHLSSANSLPYYQLGLQHLRALREMQHIKNNTHSKEFDYALSLLYYWIKLCSAKNYENTVFLDMYSQVTGKFERSLDPTSDIRKNMQAMPWFSTYISILCNLCLMLSNQKSNSISMFSGFWHNMKSAKAFEIHFKFLYTVLQCCNIASVQEIWLQTDCCNHKREHVVYAMMQHILQTYLMVQKIEANDMVSTNYLLV